MILRYFAVFLLTSIYSISYSNDVLQKKVALSRTEYTSTELFRELANKHSLNLFYNSNDIDCFTIYKYYPGKAEDVIKQVSEYNNLEYKLVNNQLVFKKKKKIPQKTAKKETIQSNSVTLSGKNNDTVQLLAFNFPTWHEPRNVELLKNEKEMKLKSDNLQNYRKRILSALLIAMVISNTNTFSQFDFGITAGCNRTALYEMRSEDLSAKYGYQFGITMITPINKSVFLRNDLLFVQDRFDIAHTEIVNYAYNYNSFSIFNLNEELNLSSFRIPLTINYVFQTEKMNFYFGFGGYYEYFISGKNVLSWSYGGKDETIEKKIGFEKDGYYGYNINPNEVGDTLAAIQNANLSLHRNQFGLIANIGLSRKNWIFNLSYSPSMIQFPIEGYGKLNQWQFNITYLLDFRKKKQENLMK